MTEQSSVTFQCATSSKRGRCFTRVAESQEQHMLRDRISLDRVSMTPGIPKGSSTQSRFTRAVVMHAVSELDDIRGLPTNQQAPPMPSRQL